MEDIIIRTNVTEQFKNRELNNATQKIIKIGEKMQKNLYEIANVLAVVDKKEAYKDDGFTSAADYAMKVFGFKKTQAYTLLKVGKEWTSPKLESTLPHEEGKDFTVTQVEKLSALGSKDEVLEVVKNGEVTPDMTVAEIREFVKVKKGGEEVKKETEETIVWDGTADTMRSVNAHIEVMYQTLKDIEFLLGNSKYGKTVSKFVDFVNDMKSEFEEIIESENKEEATND